MKYHGEEALGLIETRGMVPALYALDVMCKAADVILCSYENIGSGLEQLCLYMMLMNNK